MRFISPMPSLVLSVLGMDGPRMEDSSLCLDWRFVVNQDSSFISSIGNSSRDFLLSLTGSVYWHLSRKVHHPRHSYFRGSHLTRTFQTPCRSSSGDTDPVSLPPSSIVFCFSFSSPPPLLQSNPLQRIQEDSWMNRKWVLLSFENLPKLVYTPYSTVKLSWGSTHDSSATSLVPPPPLRSILGRRVRSTLCHYGTWVYHHQSGNSSEVLRCWVEDDCLLFILHFLLSPQSLLRFQNPDSLTFVP